MKRAWAWRVGAFFVAVYGVCGVLWLPVLLSGAGLSTSVNQALVAGSTCVPSVLGVLFTYLTKDPAGRRDFWRRLLRWPRGRARMVTAALLITPVLNLLAYFLPALISGQEISLAYATEMLSSGPLLIQFLGVEFVFGALSEELGWRGYILDELQSRWSALTSSLVLGVLWALWHTPAFLTPGMSQYEMGGLFSWPYVSFLLAVTAGSVVHTWAYNNTGRSILVAGVLMHFLSNAAMIFTGGIFDRFSAPDGYWLAWPMIYGLVAAVLVAGWGPQTLNRAGYWRKSWKFNASTAVQN